MATSMRQYWDLTKPRVVALIVFTALVGMLLAIEGMPTGEEALRGALGFLGIWLAASSAAAINQILDQRIDAKMAPVPQKALARVNQSARWNSRSIEKWRRDMATPVVGRSVGDLQPLSLPKTR